MPHSAGRRLGPFEIVALIGAGGMGDLYRARDPRLGRDVAIKVLPVAFSADPDRLHRFEREARAAAALNHPNILAVYDIGAEGDAPFIVSELLEGETSGNGSMPARLPFARRSSTAFRSRTGWRRRMTRESFIAISNPRTCSSPGTIASRSSTSGWRS
jgi:serine/threonine protein kinase